MDKVSGNETWMVYTKRADFNALSEELDVSPVTVRVMRNRGLETADEMRKYLFGTLEEMYDPEIMKGLSDAVDIAVGKLKDGVRIRIVGDYDVDGICSTYLLYTGLRRAALALEAEDTSEGLIDYEIPDRVKDGYGINISIIEAASHDGVDTIITCDNGIAAFDEVALAKELGMTVIVTDHHEIPVEDGREILPPADAVVDPHQEGETYPFAELCGSGVIYKFLKILYERCNVPESEWNDLLDITAVATVGDVMKLEDENRIIVKYGLKQIAHTKNIGLKKLVEATGLDPYNISAYNVGYVLGPCLNASGRLQSAKLGLKLLLSEDEEEAAKLAEELKELNDMRKDMTAKGEGEAIRQVEELYPDDKVLVVFLADCHESIAGIVAGRLREHFNRPAIVLTYGEEMVKGSARSIEQYHMYQALCEVSDLLVKFGGHPMAAGLSLLEKDIPEFRRRLNENAKLTEEDLIPKIWIDVPMPLDYINEKLIDELDLLEPFGQGNEKPLFAQKSLRIRSARIFGKNRNLVKMTLVTETGLSMTGLLFTDGDEFEGERNGRDTIDIAYYPEVDEYNGMKSLQVVIKYYKFH